MKKRQIHARLIEQGSNFRRFALAHGYKPRTVTQAGGALGGECGGVDVLESAERGAAGEGGVYGAGA